MNKGSPRFRNLLQQNVRKPRPMIPSSCSQRDSAQGGSGIKRLQLRSSWCQLLTAAQLSNRRCDMKILATTIALGERARVSGVCEKLTHSPGAYVRQSCGYQNQGNTRTEVSMIAISDLDERGLRRVTFTHTEPADHFSTLALHRHSEPLAHGDERRVGKTAKLIDLHARLTFRPACHSGPAPPASAPFGCQTTHACTD